MMKQEYKIKLQAIADAVTNRIDALLLQTGAPYDELKRAMAYSVNAGGKRIRAVLAAECARLFGASKEVCVEIGCAVEMVHTYSLIHDDLPCMDNDDLRRGKPSCHKAFDEATALLAGDALLTLAFAVIAHMPKTVSASPENCLRASEILSICSGMDGMIGGQIMDLDNEANPEITSEILIQTNALKTSALLSAACQMGAAVAGASDEMIHSLSKYGYHLGLAFQIIDDILDVTSTEAELGKPIGSDIENQKITFVTLLSLDGAKALAETHTKKAAEILVKLPDSSFLTELTQDLLNRRA